jgi:hypothetical protein
MFILVLTILGLTLFSLSSLESQFFYRSSDEQAALYAAMSGIERSKFVLSATDSLGAVRDTAGVPIEGLNYTVAKQGTDYDTADSIHAMSWTSGKPVWIRSLAIVNGQRALIEAKFTPSRNALYGRLFTLSDPVQGLDVPQYSSPGVSASAQVYLTGALTQRAPTVTFPGDIGSPPNPVNTSANVDPPDLGTFFGKYWATAQFVPPNCHDTYFLDASSATDQVGFFKSPLDSSDDPEAQPPLWSLNTVYGGTGTHICPPEIMNVTVRGTCIWMFDHGARLYKPVQVAGSGNTNDALILVAGVNKTTGSDAGYGIVFKQGVNSNVPIVMVSSGAIGITHYQSLSSTSNISYLSVFASTSDVVGPKTPGHSMVLTHVAGASQDQPGGVIRRLVEKGYLPNTTVSTGDFTPIAGTWREIKSSDGTN